MTCMIPGCSLPAVNVIGVRCRKPPQRNAVWAPDLEAFLCKTHAESGVDVTLTITPANHGDVNAQVMSGGTIVAARRAPIRQRAA
jgi:hypothetical protein